MEVIEKSPTHEVYRGSVCALRMDWSREGVRFIYTGHVDESCCRLIVHRLDVLVRSAPSLAVLHDLGSASGLDAKVRTHLVEWSNRHPHGSVNAFAQSKVIIMSLNAWALSTPTLKIYSSRPEFDILCRKFGLPINIQMPAPTRI